MDDQHQLAEFERFLRAFPSCPVCGKDNENAYLHKFFFSARPDDIRLRNSLLSAIGDILDITAVSEEHVKVGIPCCRCYARYFENNESNTGAVIAPYIFKLVVAGPDESDKTRLVRHFCTNTFVTDHKMTIGAAFSIKDLYLDNRQCAKIQVWDFATQKRFRFLLGDYCRGASGALVCFSVTSYDSFEQVPAWITLIRKEAPYIPIMLVGTGCEQPRWEVPYEMASQYANDAGCVGASYCSSTRAINVEEMFQCIARWMVYYFNATFGR